MSKTAEIIQLRSTKKCAKCGEIKTLEHFGKHIRAKDGMRGRCRTCESIANGLYRQENKAKVRAMVNDYRKRNPKATIARRKRYQEKLHHDPHVQALWIVQSAKKRCKVKNIPFNLMSSDIIIPEFCPVLGIRLERGIGVTTNNSPSLDRIHPDLGYIKGNVIIVSQLANQIKSNATSRQIRQVADFYERLGV